MIVFKNSKEQKLLKAILSQYPYINQLILRKALSKKDIKVNGKRVRDNIDLQKDDEVCVYIDDIYIKPNVEIVFEDENIIVVNKTKKMEVTSPDATKQTLEIILRQMRYSCYPVHRLDTNTTGLVIFAKSVEAQKMLIEAFSKGFVIKHYLTLVYSQLPIKDEDAFKDYITKNENTGIVRVESNNTKNSCVALLDYKVIKTKGDLSLLDITLHTGRTHQIRAQLSYHKMYVVGDGKYGDKQINRKLKINSQCLCAYQINFSFPKGHILQYLNQKVIKTNAPFSNLI